MKSRSVSKRGALLLAVFAAALAIAAEPGPGGPKSPGYSMELKVSPAGPGQYVGEATVKDLATGETVFSPRLQIAAGKSNAASSSDDGNRRDYLLSISIEGEGKQANTILEIHEGETLLASQRSAIKLR